MAYKFVTSKQRSELMSKIRSNNTKPELLLQRKLWGQGLRFSKKISNLPGKPDIVLEKTRIAIFIDGEFWHGYKWREKRKKIKANRPYWVPKIERNISRDKRNNQRLRKAGWKVIRFWEHQITKDLPKCIKKIKELKKAPLR
jgi:DNA mismatch endonuclease (patch repair protein)